MKQLTPLAAVIRDAWRSRLGESAADAWNLAAAAATMAVLIDHPAEGPTDEEWAEFRDGWTVDVWTDENLIITGANQNSTEFAMRKGKVMVCGRWGTLPPWSILMWWASKKPMPYAPQIKMGDWVRTSGSGPIHVTQILKDGRVIGRRLTSGAPWDAHSSECVLVDPPAVERTRWVASPDGSIGYVHVTSGQRAAVHWKDGDAFGWPYIASLTVVPAPIDTSDG